MTKIAAQTKERQNKDKKQTNYKTTKGQNDKR